MADLLDIATDDPQAQEIVDRLLPEVPEVDASLDWIWRAWHRLSDDRPQWGGGMGPSVPGRIPWITLHTWSQHHDLSRAEMAMLDLCIGEMDAVYLTWWTDNQAKAPDP